MKHSASLFVLVLVPVLALALPRFAVAGDITLTGTVSGEHHTSYQELPFEVPEGTARITVSFDYPRDAGVVIDLGIIDPERPRGWSGGNKSRFTLGEVDATPSYLPGPIPPGTWKLLLGIPRADEGASVEYQARIEMFPEPAANTRPFAPAPLKPAPGWYRGDLHMHSGQSDGHCAGLPGGDIPCPLWRTAAAASERGLDFIAITEHNTRSHFNGMRAMQPYFGELLLIPGQEITTFHGHANLLGSTGRLDFRLTEADAAPLVAGLVRSGGLLSINHPGLPTGARCMGCGWSADIDPGAITAVEVLNGGALRAAGGRVHSPISGIPFWKQRLAEGRRVTAVAGSDNHDPARPAAEPGAIGSPTTVVHAAELSQAAVLEGLQSGRVFIDVRGSLPDTVLHLRAESGQQNATMGGTLAVPRGQDITLSVTATHLEQGEILAWYRDTPLVANEPRDTAENGVDGAPRARALEALFTLASDGEPGWLRVEVRSPGGRTLLLSNPVYLNLPGQDHGRLTFNSPPRG